MSRLPFESDGDDHELRARQANPLAGVEQVRVQQHLDPEGNKWQGVKFFNLHTISRSMIYVGYRGIFNILSPTYTWTELPNKTCYLYQNEWLIFSSLAYPTLITLGVLLILNWI